MDETAFIKSSNISKFSIINNIKIFCIVRIGFHLSGLLPQAMVRFCVYHSLKGVIPIMYKALYIYIYVYFNYNYFICE